MRSVRSSLPAASGLPRRVPLHVAARVMFGGFINQFGWCFLGFGMIFVWIFGANADVAGLVAFQGPRTTVPATVTSSEPTGASEGGGEHSEGTPIYANHYRFEYQGKTYAGVSYATGNRLEPGSQVPVEIAGSNPRRSRIRGMRSATFGPIVLLVFIFPVVGLAFLGAGLWQSLKALRLLRHGEVAEGKVVEKKRTNMTINNRRVYRLTFAFTTRDGRKLRAIARTHQSELLEDEALEPLLYDPADPTRSTLLDHLPGGPRIGRQGEIWLQSAFWTLPLLVLPLLTVILNGFVIAWLLFSP